MNRVDYDPILTGMTSAASQVKRGRVVIAVGGNALVPDGDHTAIDDQRRAARDLAATVRRVLRAGWSVVVTHGNGPQVGFILRRSELSRDAAIPRIDLAMAVADSQGGIGHLLAAALQAELASTGEDHRVAAVLTHTVVDAADPAFDQPTKPIGLWYSRDEADAVGKANGWTMAEERERGWRRVVASPAPLRLLESRAVMALVERDFVVVAAGGGGIPMLADQAAGYRDVEAVIDKDYASALLASVVGADVLLLTTGVAAVAVDFGLPTQRFLSSMTMAEAERYLGEGQFPPGSMGPKVQAALQFLRSGGQAAIISSLDNIEAALAGDAGTRIVASNDGTYQPSSEEVAVGRDSHARGR